MLYKFVIDIRVPNLTCFVLKEGKQGFFLNDQIIL